jgi:hypothetical protein
MDVHGVQGVHPIAQLPVPVAELHALPIPSKRFDTGRYEPVP